MLIIPALYLSHGNCVSQYKGERGQSVILSRDPLRSAREFEKQGARTIHLVDADASDGGGEENRRISKIIAKNTALEVQYAEGISSYEMLKQLLESGIVRVSLNQFSEKLLEQALIEFGPDKIHFTIRAERDSISGKFHVNVLDYAKDITKKGVTTIIFRDTLAEGTFHPNFDEVDRLVLGTSAHIFPLGACGSMSDLEL